MEIDITDFVKNEDPCEFSASQAELGRNAGEITWGNAVNQASYTDWITAENRDEFEAWVKEFGAWDEDHIKGWSLDECNALVIQYVSGDLRELNSLCPSSKDEFGISWKKAEFLSHRGTISGNVYKGDDGRIYFYLGN